MSFPVYFFRADKKANSTKQYSLSQAALTIQNCTLNDSCSVVNPVIIINPTVLPVASQNVYSLNYCYIGLWGRFYFINDWIWNNGLWCATCSVDVLATYRGNILNTSMYVMRSSRDANNNLVYDGNIGDSKYPTTAGAATYTASAVNNPYTGVEGVYIAGVINSNSNNGAITYYAFNQVGFRQFCTALYNYSSGWLNIDVTEISENLQKALVNPFQYVVSCMYLPINVQDIIDQSAEATTTIRFGWWSVTVANGARIVDTRAYISKTYSLTIPRHPQAASRGYYLNLAPFAIYTLRAYPFGTVNIDSEAIAYWNTLDLHISIDVCTGRGILNICVNGMNNPIQTIETPVGVTIPTASLQVNYQQITGSSSMLAGGAAFVSNVTEGSGKWYNNVVQNAKNFISSVKEGNAGAVIKEIAGDVASAAVAAQTTAEIRGQQGCASGYLSQTYTLSGRFLPIAPEDFDHNGRPLLQYKILDDLSGFIMCQNVDLKISCTDRERAAIESYLLSGFYLE